MLEGLRHLVLGRHWTEILHDTIDILIVAFIVYRALLVLRGTRAMQMGIGFVIFGLLYLVAKYGEFITLLNVLSWLASSLILIVVVVFQNDIRRALIRMGAKAWLSSGREQQSKIVDEVVEAATELARHRIGAIITFERDANLLEFVRSEGIVLESAISRELLVSLFLPESLNKTHDGAVLIRNLRIARAGMFFPMPEGRVADPNFGSRHRAAIGITEETDAVVVVVSEERGTITLCFGGSYVANIDGSNLRKTLLEQLGHKPDKERKPFMQRLGLGLRRAAKSEDEAAPTTAKTVSKAASAGRAAAEPASTSERRKSKAGAAKPASTTPAPAATDDKEGRPTKPVGKKGKAAAGDKRDEKATGEKATGEKATGEKATGEKATGEKATGEKATGEKATGEKATGDDETPATLRRSTKVSDTVDVTPPPGDTEVVESTRTPPPSRVSKPMPQPKERKPASESAAESLDVATSRTSVTKSMMPTELPGAAATTRGDEG